MTTTQTQPFNGLTPAEAERLALLAEECGEVIQAIGKILRHGYENYHPDSGVGLLDGRELTNRESLERECGDVRHAIIRLCQAKDLSEANIHLRSGQKWASVKRYMHHQ